MKTHIYFVGSNRNLDFYFDKVFFYVEDSEITSKICCSFENLTTEWRAVSTKSLTAKFLKKQQILDIVKEEEQEVCTKCCAA